LSSTPLVTIAIPTYNRAESYLRQSLESVLAQTYQDLEVIVSDNCSPDNTERLAAEYCRGDKRLTYFRQRRNIGPNSNFNFCLAKARGRYFLLLPDDDLIDPDFVETCVRAGRDDPRAGIIRTGIRVINDTGLVLWEKRNEVRHLPVEEFFRGWFAGKTAWYLASTLFDTALLREMGGFHSKHHLLEDCVAVAKLAGSHGRVDVEDIKASFRQHRGEITFAVKAVEWGEDFLDVLDLMCELSPPAKAALVRREGRRFFARLTYNRARSVESAVQRLKAYLEIWRLFDYPVMLPASELARGIRRRFRRAGRDERDVQSRNAG
jgi:glycosyltransferase involved in cell wall biosynthesis